MSKQDILKVHKVVGEENEADALIEHVPRGVLNRLSDALGYWFLDAENMKAKTYSEVCDWHWNIEKME